MPNIIFSLSSLLDSEVESAPVSVTFASRISVSTSSLSEASSRISLILSSSLQFQLDYVNSLEKFPWCWSVLGIVNFALSVLGN